MKLAFLCLLVAACSAEPTFIHAHVSMTLETDDPASARFEDFDLYAYQRTHMHGDTTKSVDVDLRLEIDGLELPMSDADRLGSKLRGYPEEIFVLVGDQRKPLDLVPFFTARVEVSDTAFVVTFDPPAGDGEIVWLELTTSTGYESIVLPLGATTGEAPRADAKRLNLRRGTSADEDFEGLAFTGGMSVSRPLVAPLQLP